MVTCGGITAAMMQWGTNQIMVTCGGITAAIGEPTNHGDLWRNYSGVDATGNQRIMASCGGTAAEMMQRGTNQLW